MSPVVPSMADRDGKIWMDGELVEWRDAKIHVLTHTLHYGCGVFEGVQPAAQVWRGVFSADGAGVELTASSGLDEHLAVEVTWFAYQQIIAAYADQNRQRGKALLTSVIDRLRSGLPAGPEELATLGRTLHRRREDVLAYFDHRASNGPTEAINGRLEALRRNALGFRNLINYRIRSLLHCGNLAL